MNPADDNECRHHPSRKGHVESWFLRANHPRERRALWLKATLLDDPAAQGPVAEAWCSVFGPGRARGARTTVPLSEARVAGPLSVAGCTFDLGAGTSEGRMGDLRWSLGWKRVPGPLGEPLCMLPSRRLLETSFPKNKFVTPAPFLSFDGWLETGGDRWDLSGWNGMQGHNWGPAHSPEYAWGQCLFHGGDGAPLAMVEAVSGRLEIAGWMTPRLSAMVVRRADREYRFDRLLDLWNQGSSIERDSWTLRMAGSAGVASLTMRAEPSETVCLGYDNPFGRRSFCFNSKMAEVELTVDAAGAAPFTCRSEHGGALEFLRREPDPRFSEVV